MKIIQWLPETLSFDKQCLVQQCVCDDGNVYYREFNPDEIDGEVPGWELYAEPPTTNPLKPVEDQ